MKKIACKCHPESPFLWNTRKDASIVAHDRTFKPQGEQGLTTRQAASERIKRERAAGKVVGVIDGISRDKEAERARIKAYHQPRPPRRSQGVDIDAVHKAPINKD